MLVRWLNVGLGDVQRCACTQLQQPGLWRSASKGSAVPVKQEADAKPPPGPGKRLKITDLNPSLNPINAKDLDNAKDPIYDQEAWLEHNFPQYGWKAKGPFYHWATWANKLPKEDVELYSDFDLLMSVESRRCNFIKQAMWEVSRLWYWQHMRCSGGLHPDPTPEQLRAEALALGLTPPPVVPASAGSPEAPGRPASSDGPGSSTGGADAAPGVDPAGHPAPAAPEPPASKGVLVGSMTQVLSEVPAPSGKPERYRTRQMSEDEAAEDRWQRLMQYEERAVMGAGTFKLREKVRHGNYRLMMARKMYDDEGDEKRPLAGPADEDVVRLEEMHRAEPLTPGGFLKPALDQQKQMERVTSWANLGILDRSATLERLYREFYEQSQERYMKKEVSYRLRDDGYAFSLASRPPTAYLDLLTDYLQLKYADVVARRDEVNETLHAMTGTDPLGYGTLGPNGRPQFEAATVQLSPVEVQELNRAASEKLVRDPLEFIDFVQALHKDRLITDAELSACRRAAEAALNDAAVSKLASQPVEADVGLKAALLAAVRGDAPATSSSSSSEAGSAWATAAASGYAGWAARMKTRCRDDLATLRASGTIVSEEQEQALMQWWDQPVSWGEAEAMWRQCSDSTGAQYAPTLEEVLQMDARLRGPGAGQAGTEVAAANRLLAMRQEALERQMDCSGAPKVDMGQLDIRDPLQLSAAFPLASMEGILKQHWEQVGRRFLQQETGAKGPGWEELLQLMSGVYGQLLEAARNSPTTAPEPASSPVSHEDDLKAQLREASRRLPANTKRWQQYGRDLIKKSSTGPKYAFGGPDAPPYPAASRIVRFDQSFVLHAGSAMMDHPVNRHVVMRVRLDELAREAGLSERAAQHIAAVAGPRYRRDSGELVLACRRYQSREENRKWCMEALHALLHEGQAAHPSSAFLFSRLQDPFVLTGPKGTEQ